MRRRVVVILVGGRLPHGDATANRAMSLAAALRSVGREALVLSDFPVEDPDGRRADPSDSYENIGVARASRVGRLVDRFRRQDRLTEAILSHGFGLTDVDALIVHASLYGHLLQRWAELHGISLVVDLMERHEPSQFPAGRLDIRYIRHRRTSRLAQRRPAGLLLISAHLAGMLRPRVPVLVVPPFVDVDEMEPPAAGPNSEPGRVVFAYAGTPNRKDLLGPFIGAVAGLDPESRGRVTLTIAGPSLDGLRALGEIDESSLEACGDSVQFAGRLSRSEVKTLWAESDFCVLLRPAAGYAVAGFPSKVPEAMAAGAALFGTAHGDLAKFVRDGHDAVVMPNGDRAEVLAALQRVLAMPLDDLVRLGQAARATATAELSVASWAPKLDDFLAHIGGSGR